MKKLSKAYFHPSAAFTIKPRQVAGYSFSEKKPEVGDVVFGEIVRVGQHGTLENVSGRIHNTHIGSKALFVFGNRYSPDYYEAFIPESIPPYCDLIARSGVIGVVKTKNALIKDPTRIKVLGYGLDSQGEVVNTRRFSLIAPRETVKKKNRAKLVLVVGTAMNAGKSMAAEACVWALATMGYGVRGSKITGTASLQDILRMNDAGAERYNDFTHLGYPSTYMISEQEVLDVFNKIDLRFANNARNYWVVEFADGILQRETAMLLAHPDVKNRIHRLVFAAHDAFGALGGIRILEEKYGLAPDAVSGVCSGSPLHIRELKQFTDIPVFNSAAPDLNELTRILV
ncbi:MAG: hypothetical protein ACLFRP_09040 [Puniceicoccaceae bacterium]